MRTREQWKAWRLRRRRRWEQRFIGLGALGASGLVIWICSTSETAAEQDGTALLLLIPLALYLIFGHNIILENSRNG